MIRARRMTEVEVAKIQLEAIDLADGLFAGAVTKTPVVEGAVEADGYVLTLLGEAYGRVIAAWLEEEVGGKPSRAEVMRAISIAIANVTTVVFAMFGEEVSVEAGFTSSTDEEEADEAATPPDRARMN